MMIPPISSSISSITTSSGRRLPHSGGDVVLEDDAGFFSGVGSKELTLDTLVLAGQMADTPDRTVARNTDQT